MLVEERAMHHMGEFTGEWSSALVTYCAWMVASGWSPGTIGVKTKYLRRLQRATGTTSPWDVTEDQLLAFLSEPHWAPETRKSVRSAVRTFYKWAYDSRRINVDPSGRLPTVKVPPAPPRPAPDAALENALERSEPRVRLMLLLAARGGLRRAEIASLHTSWVQGGSLRVKGKGGKSRLVPIHPDVADYLQGLPEGYVFPGNDRGHLSPDRVGRLMSDALGPGWTAHTLRHRFATKGYEGSGHDLFSLQEVMGHASSDTTRRYTATSFDAAMRIVMAS
jgi:integrase